MRFYYTLLESTEAHEADKSIKKGEKPYELPNVFLGALLVIRRAILLSAIQPHILL